MKRSSRSILLMVVILLTTSACGAPAPAAPPPTQALIAPSAVPSDTPLPPPTPIPPTPVPPTPVPPTAVPATLPPPAPTSPVRIQFEPGATDAALSATIQAGQSVQYLLRAGPNVPMFVTTTSPNNRVFFSLVGVNDGSILADAAYGTTNWSGILTQNQDYRITVVATEASVYTLQVVIPARIQFKAGAVSSFVAGKAGAHRNNTYVLRAMAGQTMSVNIVSPQNKVLLTVYGLSDGQPLVRSASDATSWSGQLPATQDYVIVAVNTGEACDYTLQVGVQ